MTYQDDDQAMSRGSSLRSVSAFYDNREDAEDAVQQLRELGIADADIRLTHGQQTASSDTGTTGTDSGENKGFFEMLGEFFFPSDDRSAYAEGLNRGGHLVTVSGLSEDDYDDVIDILDDEGAVDMDERTASWRAEGWSESAHLGGNRGSRSGIGETSGITGFDESGTASAGLGASGAAAGLGGMATRGGAAGMGGMSGAGDTYGSSGSDMTGSLSDEDLDETSASLTRERSGYGLDDTVGSGLGVSGGSLLDETSGSDMMDPSDQGIAGAGSAGYGSSRGSMGGAAGTVRSGDDDTVEVVEERLRVGKRDASRGGVRVRSYVIEEPVSETVSLREERVELERRPVDRSVTDRDGAFQERSIEAEEYGEEAVVQKEARVVEEIGLRKTSTTRDETVSDTLRHTEVEIEDDRDDTTGSGITGTPTR